MESTFAVSEGHLETDVSRTVILLPSSPPSLSPVDGFLKGEWLCPLGLRACVFAWRQEDKNRWGQEPG